MLTHNTASTFNRHGGKYYRDFIRVIWRLNVGLPVSRMWAPKTRCLSHKVRKENTLIVYTTQNTQVYCTTYIDRVTVISITGNTIIIQNNMLNHILRLESIFQSNPPIFTASF